MSILSSSYIQYNVNADHASATRGLLRLYCSHTTSNRHQLCEQLVAKLLLNSLLLSDHIPHYNGGDWSLETSEKKANSQHQHHKRYEHVTVLLAGSLLRYLTSR